ncbi:MAG: S1 RNA-binding domain-containing protein [Planctomycetota bacterium]
MTDHEKTEHGATEAAAQPAGIAPVQSQPDQTPSDQGQSARNEAAQTEPAPSEAPAPSASREDAPTEQAAPSISDAANAQIDEAMAKLGLGEAASGHAEQPQSGAKKAVAHPRVVSSGREHRKGLVVSVGPTDVFIEFGPKELGVVERTQFKIEADLPKVGDELEVVVNRYEPGESLFVCSLPGTVVKADWEMLEAGQTVEARVSGTNKGGLELEVAGHRAFMPASQVALERIPDLSVFVGEKIECKVQRIDRRGSGNIVLSRREVLNEERAKSAEKLREALKVGDTVKGRVRKIMPFGAFVDLGGVDGLVHISDLSHERVGQGEKAVERFVQEGQEVSVQILSIDWEKNRLSLGMKQLQADPLQAAADEIAEGADVTGKVTRLADFGAFIEIAPGVEGLAHISELEWRRVNHPTDVLQQGEVVQCRVLKFDQQSRKISLSLKALKEPPARPGGGKGGRGDRDGRSAEDIAKERDTPRLRRMREEAKRKKRQQSGGGGLGGLEEFGGGLGLGDLKL